MTEGKVGSFFKDGEQVGGFFLWRLDVDVQSVEKRGEVARRLQAWSCTASQYWTAKLVFDVEARFYPDEGDWYWSSRTYLVYPSGETNILLPIPITFTGNEPLNAVYE